MDENEPECQACKDHEAIRKGMNSEPPEWFAKCVVALITFIIVVVTLVIVL